MNILQGISYLYPAWSYGGPGKLVWELSKSLAASDQNVEIVTTDAFDSSRRRYASDNPGNSDIKILVFKNFSNSIAYRYKAFLSPGAVFHMYHSKSLEDVVHIHEIFTPLAVAAAVSCFKKNIPLFVSAHGSLSGYHLLHRRGVKSLFFRLFEKYFRHASGFIAATDEEKKEYEGFGIDPFKIHVVPNGIDISKFHNLPRRGAFRKKYRIGKEEFIALYIGRINRLKGLDTLVGAMEQSKQHHNLRLVIGGTDDGYLQMLQKQVHLLHLEEQVLFPGLLGGSLKLAALRDADIFVYPSPEEGFSLAILEAGASKLPLVLTKGCKFDEVGRSGAGRIVHGTANDFAREIQDLADHKEKVKRMGEAAGRLVQNRYAIEIMSKRLQKIYKTTDSQ